MVDVLKRGPELGEKVYISNCAKCGSELRWKSYEAAEIDEAGVGVFSVVHCPVCGERVSCGVNFYEGSFSKQSHD